MITVETAEELEKALSPRTAMIYLLGRTDPGPVHWRWKTSLRIAKPRNIPILVDAAAEVLTIPNVHLQRGATIVAYSGGKAIRGPQCAGLLLGRKDILQSAWQASSPHHGPGRDNKVGREETLGMLAAVEAWVKRDHAAEWKTWLSWLDTIAQARGDIDGIKTALREPTGLVEQEPVARDHAGIPRSSTSPAKSWPRNWRERSRGSRSARVAAAVAVPTRPHG